MRRRSPGSALPKLLTLIAAMTLIGAAHAAPAGTITHLSGTISVKRIDGSSKLLSVSSEVMEGDELTTQRDTYARIKFADGGEVVMRPDTALKIAGYTYDEHKPASDNVVLGLLRGGLRAITGLIGKRNRDAYQVRTTTATIGIRGTHFGALLCSDNCSSVQTVSGQPPENGLHVDVAQGAIIVTNRAGQQIFSGGQFGFVQDEHSIPTLRAPTDGIRVTMPQAISQNNASGSGIGREEQTQCLVQ